MGQEAVFVRLAEVEIDAEVSQLLGHEYALRFLALPISQDKTHLRVAMCDPLDTAVIGALTDLTGHFIIPVAAHEDDLRFHINKVFGDEAMDSIASQFLVDERVEEIGEEFSDEILAKITEAPVVRFIDSLIETAALSRASDIHIEPFGEKLRARCRIDGLLETFSTVGISLLPNVISRLKIMGGMDISEKRLPQDGHFSMFLQGEKIEFRLSTLPTAFGEKAVIRLLYGKRMRLKKEELGFFEDDLTHLTELFTRPYGAIFMTGPTGSGKSTTLNCFLEEMIVETQNIVTVEDPVETPIIGVNHVNVAQKFSFASALRHILRQDPDTIMIGEIRDEETARIAIQSAITGHVVLSTLHTNDAAGVIERLLDMGIEPYLAAAALNGVISQRLVRRICRECATPSALTEKQSWILNLPQNTPVFEGKGCAHCNNTGYRRRFAVYEYIILNEKMRRKICIDPAKFSSEIRRKSGLRENALRALKAGHTTAEEVIRALNRDGAGEDVDD